MQCINMDVLLTIWRFKRIVKLLWLKMFKKSIKTTSDSNWKINFIMCHIPLFECILLLNSKSVIWHLSCYWNQIIKFLQFTETHFFAKTISGIFIHESDLKKLFKNFIMSTRTWRANVPVPHFKLHSFGPFRGNKKLLSIFWRSLCFIL